MKAKKKFVSKVSATLLAGIMGTTTLMPGLEASADSGLLSRDYTYGSVNINTNLGNVNSKTHNTSNTAGVPSEYVRLFTGSNGDHVTYFQMAGKSNWGLCLRPSVTSGSLLGMNATQSQSYYWNNVVTEDIRQAVAYLMYCGYPGTVSGKGSERAAGYYAATQLLIWDLIIGWRNPETLYLNSGCHSLIEYYNNTHNFKTYVNEIVKKYNTVRKTPKNVYKTDNRIKPLNLKADFDSDYQSNKQYGLLFKYDFSTIGNTSSNAHYKATYTIGSTGNSTVDNAWKKAVNQQLNSWLTQWKSDKNLIDPKSGSKLSLNGNVSTPTGTDSVYTVSTNYMPVGTGKASSKVAALEADVNTDLDVPGNWLIYRINQNYQDLAFQSIKVDPIKGALAVAGTNYPNITIKKRFLVDEKTEEYEDAALAKKYINDVTFKVSMQYKGTTFYVRAFKSANGSGVNYDFRDFVTNPNDATPIKIDPSLIDSDNQFFTTTIYDLPTEGDGIKYTVHELVDPNSDLAKAGYPAVTALGQKATTWTLYDVDPEDPQTNAPAEHYFWFKNSQKSWDYGSIQMLKWRWDADEGEKDAESGTFVACVYHNNKIYYLKNLSTVSTGIYEVPESQLHQGSFADGANVLTTDLSEAQRIAIPTSKKANGIRIRNIPDGMKFGFIEMKAVDGLGYESKLKSNTIPLSSFASVVSGYTSEKDGLISVDSDIGPYKKGIMLPFTFGAKANKDADLITEDLINIPYYVTVKVKKTGPDGEALAGAKIRLYKDGEKIQDKTTNSKGEVTFSYKFPTTVTEDMNFTYKEISAPAGYKEDTNTYKVSFSVDPSKVNEEIQNGYGVTYPDLATIDNLPKIVNYPYLGEVHLTKTDTRTNNKMPKISFVITANQDLTADEVAAIEVRTYGDLLNTETGEYEKKYVKADGAVKAGDPIITLATNDKGALDVYKLPLGQEQSDGSFEYKYTITETNMPKGYTGNGPYVFSFDKSNYSASRSSVVGDAAILTRDIQAENAPAPIKVHINKKDNHNKPVEGVTFTVYANEDIVLNGETLFKKDDKIGSMVTDANGDAVNYRFASPDDLKETFDFEVYSTFNYYVKETKVPAHIVKSNKKIEFTAPTTEDNIPTFTYNAVNDWVTGKVAVYKVDASDLTTFVSGAKFALYEDTNKNGQYDLGTDLEMNVKITEDKENQEYVTDQALEYGTYFVQETSAPKEFVVDNNVYTAKITKNGEKVYIGNTTTEEGKIVFAETPVTGGVQVIKTDAETHDKLSGATFTVYEDTNANGAYDAGVDEVRGDMAETEKGIYEMSGLRYGNYFVEETKAPKNYRRDTNVYKFSVKKNGEVIRVANLEGSDEFVDYAKRASITLTKFDAEYPENKLSGAVFEVWKDTDKDEFITDKDVLVGTLVEGTGDNVGVYTMDGLRIGQYLVRETVAPENYNLDQGTYVAKLTKDNQVFEVTNTGDDNFGTGFANSAMKGDITLTKVDAEYPDNKLTGATFEVLKDVNANGKYDKDVDEVLGEMTEVKTGDYFFGDLRVGNYLVHETKAPEGYYLDEGYYVAVISKNGDVVQISNNVEDPENFGRGDVNDPLFLNKPVYGEAEISKEDVTTSKGLPNTTITLYNEKKEKIAEGVTDKNGKLVFEHLRYGKYYFQETKAPEGYVIDESLFEFEIKSDGTVRPAAMKNRPITGGMEVTKLDISTEAPLPNTKISLYTKDGKLLQELITDEHGLATFKDLTYGEYYFVESEAPEGYEINTDKHYFKILEDGKILKDTIKDTPKKPYKTGVENDMTMPFAVAGASAAGLFTIAIYALGKKRKQD